MTGAAAWWRYLRDGTGRAELKVQYRPGYCGSTCSLLMKRDPRVSDPGSRNRNESINEPIPLDSWTLIAQHPAHQGVHVSVCPQQTLGSTLHTGSTTSKAKRGRHIHSSARQPPSGLAPPSDRSVDFQVDMGAINASCKELSRFRRLEAGCEANTEVPNKDNQLRYEPLWCVEDCTFAQVRWR